jgi:hypothetical protein
LRQLQHIASQIPCRDVDHSAALRGECDGAGRGPSPASGFSARFEHSAGTTVSTDESY